MEIGVDIYTEKNVGSTGIEDHVNTGMNANIGTVESQNANSMKEVYVDLEETAKTITRQRKTEEQRTIQVE